MNRIVTQLALTAGLAAAALSGFAQNKDSIAHSPKNKFGIILTGTSWHDDKKANYNNKNWGGGLTYRIAEGWGHAHHTDVNLAAGAYKNSIYKSTPFAAIVADHKLRKTPLSFGGAGGVFGYQKAVEHSDLVNIETYTLPPDGVLPKDTEHHGSSVHNYKWGDGKHYGSMQTYTITKGEGKARYYPMIMPRICVDFVDNKTLRAGVSAQGGWLPGFGAAVGFAAHCILK